MKIKDLLTEMPIADYQTFGDFSKARSIHRKADRRLISNPKMIDRVKHTFKGVDQDFYFYFVNTEKAKGWSELGRVDIDWIHRIFGDEVKDAVTKNMESEWEAVHVIFTSNNGDQWKPMTPWIMAHRIGHALARYSGQFGSSHRQFVSYDHIEDTLGDMANSLLDLGFQKNFDPRYIKGAIGTRPGGHGRQHQLLYKAFCSAHLTFKSARDNNIREYFEVTNELIAQYMVTGKTPIKKEPQAFKYGNTTINPKTIENEDDYSFREIAEMYERTLDIQISTLLGEAVGSILVM